MQIDGLTPNDLGRAAQESPSRARQEAELRDACQQFESLFLMQMLNQMSKSEGKSLFGGGAQGEMMQSLLNQERARQWAESGGIGLANLLFQQMKKTL